MYFNLLLPSALLFLCSIFPACAEVNVETTIVYIECKRESVTASGSGVLISAAGHVLTAKHVVLDGASCRGSIGVADPANMHTLIAQPSATPLDAAILKFAKSDTYNFVRSCPDELASRNGIFVAGFPAKTQTGAASFRKGVLSTVFLGAQGIVETDGQTISGMSGGPVFSENLRGLVGIVIGAQFNASGSVSFYGILPVSVIAKFPGFGFVQESSLCYRKRLIELPASAETWSSDKGPLRLGVRPDEGVCFLSKVWGVFNDALDRAAVEIIDNEYVLTGSNKSGGEHGATARCVWFN